MEKSKRTFQYEKIWESTNSLILFLSAINNIIIIISTDNLLCPTGILTCIIKASTWLFVQACTNKCLVSFIIPLRSPGFMRA